jgi:hypothetical protein
VAVVTNTAEGGSDTTAVTTGNSGGGSGTAFGSVSAGAGGTITFSATQVAHGALSYQFASAAGVTCFARLDNPSNSTSFTGQAYYYLTGYPSANSIIYAQQNTSGSVNTQLLLNTSGQILVQNAAGSTQATFTNAVPLNTWTRITCFGTVSGTVGTINASMYPGDSTSATETKNLTNMNTNTLNALRIVVGKFSATTMATLYIDDISVDTLSSTELAPAALPSAARPVRVVQRIALARSRNY